MKAIIRSPALAVILAVAIAATPTACAQIQSDLSAAGTVTVNEVARIEAQAKKAYPVACGVVGQFGIAWGVVAGSPTKIVSNNDAANISLGVQIMTQTCATPPANFTSAVSLIVNNYPQVKAAFDRSTGKTAPALPASVPAAIAPASGT
jgi:hypothetical protein